MHETYFYGHSSMAHVNEGSHSFTWHPHVYSQVEWAISAFTSSGTAASHFGRYLRGLGVHIYNRIWVLKVIKAVEHQKIVEQRKIVYKVILNGTRGHSVEFILLAQCRYQRAAGALTLILNLTLALTFPDLINSVLIHSQHVPQMSWKHELSCRLTNKQTNQP